MVKALPLVTISPPSESGEPYSLAVHQDTASLLASNFATIQFFYPILVFGSFGKNSVLLSIMRQAGCVIEGESGFEGRDSYPDGVYVWPEPLPFGRVPVLLMKMRSYSGLEATRDIRRRARACAIALSFVCCLKEEMTFSLEEIQIFTQDYYPLRNRLDLEIAKLLVCADRGWYTRDPCRSKLEELTSKHPGLFEVRIPNSTAHWFQPEDLRSEAFQEPYVQTHRNLQGNSPFYIETFLKTLALLVPIADLSPSFSAFLTNVPNPRDPDSGQRLIAVSQAATSARRIRNHAHALEFLVPRSDPAGYVFDQRTLETIQRNYELTGPTVVLAVMGAPGLGKSTLLNYIIQYCIESSQCPPLFSIGNTCEHTTKGSQVLSHPLYYRGSQIMLVDLEGLGGTETLDSSTAVLQANLVSALLTVASVPCILVRNEAVSLVFARETISQIASLQRTFGFKMERIFLLFHDRSSESHGNADFENFTRGVNSKFFHGAEVVKMLNKPNLSKSKGEEKRRRFLDSFLSEGLYMKKNVSDTYVNILALITQIGVIAQHRSTNLTQLKLTMTEVKEYDRFVSFTHAKLTEVLANLKAAENTSLLSLFNERIRLIFYSEAVGKLALMSDGLKAHCKLSSDLEIEAAKIPLEAMEAYHNFISLVPEDQMIENIKQVVDGYYKSAWSIAAFLPRVELLEHQLQQVREHYPASQAKMTNILSALKGRKEACIGWTAVRYTAQAALAVITFGIGAVITAGSNFAFSLSAAGQSSKMSLETASLRGLGERLGKDAGPTWAAGICTNLIFPQRAAELVWINSAWGNRHVNGEVLEPIKRNLRNKVPIVLMIGSKATATSDFANYFMRYIAPFTLDEFAVFHPDKYTQTLAFDYFNPGMSEVALTGYVICLRMKKKIRSSHSQAMLEIAEVLMSIASVACLLVDRPKSYSHTLLNTLCPPTAPESPRVPALPTKVMVVSSNREAEEEIKCALVSSHVSHEVRLTTSFSKNALALVVGGVKDLLDRSLPQLASLVVEKVTSLPSLLQRL